MDAPAVPSADPLLAKVMYDREPHTYGTFDEFQAILCSTGGDLTTISHGEFTRAVECDVGGLNLLRGLAANGVEIATVRGEVLEKTGLLGLAGTLKQVESGHIPSGARVLVCLTGGTAQPSARATPESFICSTGAQETGAVRTGLAR
jgi:hypothetical protein